MTTSTTMGCLDPGDACSAGDTCCDVGMYYSTRAHCTYIVFHIQILFANSFLSFQYLGVHAIVLWEIACAHHADEKNQSKKTFHFIVGLSLLVVLLLKLMLRSLSSMNSSPPKAAMHRLDMWKLLLH